MNESKEATARKMGGQVEALKLYPSFQEAVGIDGEAIEFEWNISPRFSSFAILQEIQKDLARKNIQPEAFKDRIIFISMFNNIDWSKRKNDDNCISNAEKVKNAMKFSQRSWTFLGPGSEKVVWKIFFRSKKIEWDSLANKMVWRFKETGHPVFESISASSRRILKKKKKGKDTTQFNTELLFQTIHSANQLCINGAVATWRTSQYICGQEDVDKFST